MNLIYITNARIPTEKAHGYQIVKMCEQLARHYGVELWVPNRLNHLTQNPLDFYGVKNPFVVKRIWCIDFIGRAGFLNPLVFWIQSLTFYASVYLSSVPANCIVYTRDTGVAFLLSRRGYKTFLELHSLPKNRKKLFSSLVRSLAGVIVLTEAVKNYLAKEVKINVPTLTAPDAVDLEIFDLPLTKAEARAKLNLPPEQKLIGYFGRFTTMGMDKGISDTLKALKYLPSVHFLAVGGHHKDVACYQKQAEELGVTNQTTISGSVSQSELALYQKACDILLMPFPFTEHYAYYMSPLKMFEYMASGRPIIATDLPSVREILNESNAVLVPPDQPQTLASAVTDLLNDQARGERLAKQAYQDVQNYTWEKRVERIVGFVEAHI